MHFDNIAENAYTTNGTRDNGISWSVDDEAESWSVDDEVGRDKNPIAHKLLFVMLLRYII